MTWPGSSARAAAGLMAILLAPSLASADEGGTSVWLPGSYGNLAAVPVDPGWSLAAVNYYADVSAGSSVAIAREIMVGRFSREAQLDFNAKLTAQSDLGMLAPSYAFASPVLGGQVSLGMTGFAAGSTVRVAGTLGATIGKHTVLRAFSASSSVTGIGDLFPQASLRWNTGNSNFMTYVQTTVPTGAYDQTRLANLGLNHWAVDGGAGYTYFDQKSGHEFSIVAGLTDNFENPATDYRSGTDFHVDMALSQFLSEHWQVGAVGYFFDQINDDSGTGDRLGGFRSQVAAAGPQIAYITSIAGHQTYLNLKGYDEFDAVNRPSGWNIWLTVSLKL